MLKAKFGECSVCNKHSLLYKRNPPLCKYHYYQQKNKKKPSQKSIRVFSEKRLKQLKEYRSIRDLYLKNNPKCEVIGCANPSDNLHHKAGRNGELLCNEKYFMACCRDCHPKRIHENPKWARKMGYIITIDGRR